MNNIFQIQNQQKQLERIAAFRELYSSAKRIHFWQVIFVVIIPVCISLFSMKYTEIAEYTGAYGVFITIFDLIFFEVVINARKEKASKIQEMFDCDVLDLSKSQLKTIEDIAVEEVLQHYNAHKKIPSNVEKIKNWYPNISELDISIARLVCQRTNCWWDSKLRNKYSRILKYLSSIIFFILLVIGIAKDYKFLELVLFGSTLLPFFQFCIKQQIDQKDASKRLDELRYYTENLWKLALKRSLTVTELTESSRRLQDEIFEHRKKSPLILDLFYNSLRTEDEELMNKGAEILINEARQSGLI